MHNIKSKKKKERKKEILRNTSTKRNHEGFKVRWGFGHHTTTIEQHIHITKHSLVNIREMVDHTLRESQSPSSFSFRAK